MSSAHHTGLPVRWMITALALLVTSPAFAAVTLKGVVSLDRERGAPVAGVDISAYGANPVTTGNDGQFILVFPSADPGQDVRIGVKRAGWTVVNDILLDHRLPRAGVVRPFEIIVCKAAKREPRVIEFYRLKGYDAIERDYRAKLDALEGRQAATAQERDRLLRERDQARQQVEELARQAATRRPEEMAGVYREALRLFVDGQTDAALQKLSEERLQQETAKAQEQLNQAILGWLLRGQLLTTKFDFAGAARAFQSAIEYGPSSLDAWYSYGFFHHQQNHFAEAHRGYERALALARQAPSPPTVANILRYLGTVHATYNRLTEARKAYEEALEIWRDLARQNPEAYRRGIAITLNSLGILHRHEKRLTEARKAYEEALEILRDLARKNPDAYRSDLATTLGNIGVLDSDENRLTEARKEYEEALDIWRDQARKNPGFYRAAVGDTLSNLGVLYAKENRLTEARKVHEEALKIRRALARENPEMHRPYVAGTLYELGSLHRDENRLTEAREAYEEALKILRDLEHKNPGVYRAAVGDTLDNLGELHMRANRLTEARKAYEEALGIYRQLVTTAPGQYNRDIARVERKLAELTQ